MEDIKSISLRERIEGIIRADFALGKDSRLRKLQRSREFTKKTVETDKRDRRQIYSTLLIFLLTYWVGYFLFRFSSLALVFSVMSGFVVARLFSFQHDLGHNSMIRSKKEQTNIGYLLSFFTHIPYTWYFEHNDHHNLNSIEEHSGRSDVLTYFIGSYNDLSKFRKILYIILRFSMNFLGIGGIVYLFLLQRFFGASESTLVGIGHEEEKAKNKRGEIVLNRTLTNLVLFSFYLSGYFIFGFSFLIYQFITVWTFGVIAIFFFYNQHQHAENYKITKEEFEKMDPEERRIHYALSAFLGSSQLKVGPFLNWCTNNINRHNVHHYVMLISGTSLAELYKGPEWKSFLDSITIEISIWDGVKNILFNHLYDPESNKMISFAENARRNRCKKGIHRKRTNIDISSGVLKQVCNTCSATLEMVDKQMMVRKPGVYDA